MFTPLALILTAITSALLWKESLHLGSVFGSLLLISGLYFVLWGKKKEAEMEEEEKRHIPEACKHETSLVECVTHR
ncbi:hypothetical protein Leryth_025475 [Lithospermum erythrorhizon]|nr:hypothetical protein Leryth_025475 [Lithospermum erythrorhizon]